MDYTEKYSMIKLYKFLFCMTLADEEEDLAIQKRYFTNYLIHYLVTKMCSYIKKKLFGYL